jgi:protein phosphatase 2C family protein 2/3
VDGGEKILTLSRDHKPEAPEETRRIEENGGRIYQNSNYIPEQAPDGKGTTMHLIVGPHRVFPGRLSVSRTIGDIEAKHPKYGGNPRVVVPTPDIKCFKIRNNYDFIILACDGVFEKLSNQEVVKNAWLASVQRQQATPSKNSNLDSRTIHERCGETVDRVLQFSAFKRTFDNITSVMIAFENFENLAGQMSAAPVNSNKTFEEGNSAAMYQNPILQNPFCLISEFSLLYEGVQMNGPGDCIPQNETVVEEELIDNQDTETPLAAVSFKPPQSSAS